MRVATFDVEGKGLAGVPHIGCCALSAVDGWWRFSLTAEAGAMDGTAMVGATVDLYKCFDRVPRTILYTLAAAMGVPRRILDPYQRYIENLRVHNSLLQLAALKSRVFLPLLY